MVMVVVYLLRENISSVKLRHAYKQKRREFSERAEARHAYDLLSPPYTHTLKRAFHFARAPARLKFPAA